MATKTVTTTPAPIGTAMLSQLADLDASGMSAETAVTFLRISFEPAHRRRVRVLSGKASGGTLSPAEHAELDELLRVADLLAVLHSKARQALKLAGAWA